MWGAQAFGHHLETCRSECTLHTPTIHFEAHTRLCQMHVTPNSLARTRWCRIMYGMTDVTHMTHMPRTQALDLVLVGWYHLPSSVDTPMDVALNPQGSATRSRRRVWCARAHACIALHAMLSLHALLR